jgi:hypothetical protein
MPVETIAIRKSSKIHVFKFLRSHLTEEYLLIESEAEMLIPSHWAMNGHWAPRPWPLAQTWLTFFITKGDAIAELGH